MNGSSLRIALCGPGEADSDEQDLAFAVGQRIATANAVLVCGGLTGAMSAACQGAKSAGGLTVGVLPGTDPGAANPWVDVPICTGMGQARNVIVVATANAVIALGGGFGTLSEIAHALRLGRPLVLLSGGRELLPLDSLATLPEGTPRAVRATTPSAAVDLAVALAQQWRPR